MNTKDESDPMKLPVPQFPDEIKFAEQLLRIVAVSNVSASSLSANLKPVEVIPPNVVKAVTTISTNAWKAKSRMLDASGEVRDEMKRLYRNIESILDALAELDVQIKDRCGEAFDYGLPEQVVATETQEGLSQDKIIETIKPTIYWNGQIIQRGEVIIAHGAAAQPAKPSSPVTPTTPTAP